MQDGVAPAAALVTFTTYVLSHGGSFSAAKAFTVLGLYTILVRVFSIAPTGADHSEIPQLETSGLTVIVHSCLPL